MGEAASTSTTTHAQLAIVGSGFSGLGLAIRLKQQGFDDFVVLERAAELGGVWRDCSYPGSACDVESHLYSFSFAPNPHWTRTYSPQQEILSYLRSCAAQYEVTPHLRFGHDVLEARWDASMQIWRIETSAGSYTARVLVSAMGFFSEPAFPSIAGLERFAGTLFHAARWNHAANLDGRRVGVVGTGASAVQFIPEIQPRVGKLTVFQRTPAWVVPRADHAISAGRRKLYARRPLVNKLARAALYARHELFGLGLRHRSLVRLFERTAQRHLEASVADPALRTKLTPSFRMGCKRVVVSDHYLPALGRPNVEVITCGIREVQPSGIVDEDGVLHELDAIVLATGFRVTDMPFADRIVGRDGRSLNAHWAGSPRAHLGSMVSGFPNLFLLLGPNTGLGHSSVVLMIERQIELVLKALGYLWNQGGTALEPTPEAQARFVSEVQRALDKSVWQTGNCSSWYIDRTGRNSALWPGSVRGFARRLRFRPEDYLLSRGALMQVHRVSVPPPPTQNQSGPADGSADTQENA